MRRFFLAVLLLVLPASAAAQQYAVPMDATILIEDMEGGLDGFIRAEFVKQKLPLKIVLSDDAAELVLTGSTSTRQGSWHEGWLTLEKDKATGSVMVVEKATKSMLWAGEAGDRSLFGTPFRRGGARKVAERIVKNLKKAIKTVPPKQPDEKKQST